MIRHWITLKINKEEETTIERRVFTNYNGRKYVRVYGKKYWLDKLFKEEKVIEEYDCGKEDVKCYVS